MDRFFRERERRIAEEGEFMSGGELSDRERNGRGATVIRRLVFFGCSVCLQRD